MELKDFQKRVLEDIQRYQELVNTTGKVDTAFTQFWENHPQYPLRPNNDSVIKPYQFSLPASTPHVCIKVPTGGGKTYIASAAISTIYSSLTESAPKMVVWLVPSITILDQTLRNLRNPNHPYRQRISTDFGGKVKVLDKQEALMGADFNFTSVQDNLCILVMSYDSFRAQDKEGRKVYQQNGNLQSFAPILSREDDLEGNYRLATILGNLHPLVIVDESHNAESELSIEMLESLSPCFVLDLTATPRSKSNIISFVDALELKRENMVKLPIVVYNHETKTDVINSALELQRRLEHAAKRADGRYIRPIVLFQAQPKTDDDNTTFEKLKNILIDLGIPEEQIKIKTADINEIKDMDLMSETCPVRYIITVNALKEGWDCPFAYILASLADKNSAVDVEQIVGRVLRQPYVHKNANSLLNMSYVLTASSKFLDTLDNIVKGLNKAGFSERDYTLAEKEKPTQQADDDLPVLTLTGDSSTTTPSASNENTFEEDINIEEINYKPTDINSAGEEDAPSSPISLIEKRAIDENKKFEENIINNTNSYPPEIDKQVKSSTIKTIFKQSAESILLPQFFNKNEDHQLDMFIDEEQDELFHYKQLLKNFKLGEADTNIVNFNSVESTMYSIDLEENSSTTPCYTKVNDNDKRVILDYLTNSTSKEQRISKATSIVKKRMGKFEAIPDKELDAYLKRIFQYFDEERFADFSSAPDAYARTIKKAIEKLAKEHCKKEFEKALDTDQIICRPNYKIPNKITISQPCSAISKRLHENENIVNGFEKEVINDVANLGTVEFWFRNVEKKHFYINGFINHYPDFIVKMKSGKIVLVETKGDHLDAKDKIDLGNLWKSKAGNDFRYFMVYDDRNVEGSMTKADFLEIMRNL